MRREPQWASISNSRKGRSPRKKNREEKKKIQSNFEALGTKLERDRLRELDQYERVPYSGVSPPG
jgi:hypothetical protein